MAYKDYYEYKDIMEATGKSYSAVKKWRISIERLSGYEFKKVKIKVTRKHVKDHYQFTEEEFENAKIVSKVLLEKHSTFLDFVISVSGTVDLTCDISNEKFQYPINNEIKFLVKFGEEYDDSNEEIITIPHHYSEFNIAQFIYEAVVLAIPMKKVSPAALENEEFQDLLDKFSPKINEEKADDEDIDPRWEALNKLRK